MFMHRLFAAVSRNLLLTSFVLKAANAQSQVLLVPKVIVAIGDSFAAGNGAGNYDDAVAKCGRSPESWSAQVAQLLNVKNNNTSVFINRGCSAGRFVHVTKNRYLETVRKDHRGLCPVPALNSDDFYIDTSLSMCDHFARPQMSALEDDPTVDLVLFGMGANDMEFGPLVRKCLFFALRNPRACQEQLDFVRNNARIWTQNITDTLLAMNSLLKPTAHVIVMQYPHVVEEDDPYTYNPIFGGSVELTKQLRSLGFILDESQRAAIAMANQIANRTFALYYGHAKELFAGHVTDPRIFRNNPDAWFFESWAPIEDIELEIYHPNLKGHTELARALYNYLLPLIDSTAAPHT